MYDLRFGVPETLRFQRYILIAMVHQIKISPIRYVFALPLMSTRSPRYLQARRPFRFESWMADNASLLRRFDQYGIIVVCADPVTGSSSIPDCGPKNRDTKSTCTPG